MTEPAWCRGLDEFRADAMELENGLLDDELTYEEQAATRDRMAEAVLDDLPRELRDPFRLVMIEAADDVEVAAAELQDALRILAQEEVATCAADDAGADGDDVDIATLHTDLERYCYLARANFEDYPGGRKSVYEDLLRYAPPEIRAHEVLVVSHLADVVGEDVQFDEADIATVGDAAETVRDSLDAINSFRDDNC